MQKANEKIFCSGLCFFAIIFWSITFVNTRSLLSDFSALALMFICFGLAWKFWEHTPKTIGFSRFSVLTWHRVSCGALAKGRGRRGDFSMVRIRLARFALPR